MHRFTIVLLLAACLAAPVRAVPDPTIDDAKAHAAKAKVHYDLGEYQKAAEEYILVYRIRPLPAVLYNIAQSYRRAAQYEKARQFYESYLRETDDAKTRAVVEKAIREIDELLAKEKRAKDGPPTGIAQDPGQLTPPPAKRASPPPPIPAAPPGAQSLAAPAPAQQPPAAAALTPSAPASAAVPTGSPAAQPAASRTAIGGAPGRAPAPIAVTTSAAPKPAKSHTLTWVAAGASAAALAAGGLFGAKTLSSRSPDDARKANLLYGVGGGLAVVTGALLLFDF